MTRPGTPGANLPARARTRRPAASDALCRLEPLSGYRLPAGSDRVTEETPLVFPDAWYALHPDAALQDVWRAGEVPELAFGADDRQKVPDTTLAPFRWIALLEIQAADGSQWRGSGWLAGPRLVITAGHCVHLPEQGGWATSIQVTLGAEPDPVSGAVARPFGVQTATRLRSVSAWVNGQDEQHDYGAIILDQPVYDGFGWFAWAALSDDELLHALVNIDGYPADKPNDGQYSPPGPSAA